MEENFQFNLQTRPIKDFMSKEMVLSIVGDFNNYLSGLKLKCDKAINIHIDPDNEDAAKGHYYPKKHYSVKLFWCKKTKLASKIDQKAVQEENIPVGTFVFDQFYSHIRINLPEEYDVSEQLGAGLFYHELTRELIEKAITNYSKMLIPFHLFKTHEEDYLFEIYNYIKVLNTLKQFGESPSNFEARSEIALEVMGNIFANYHLIRDEKPKTLVEMLLATNQVQPYFSFER